VTLLRRHAKVILGVYSVLLLVALFSPGSGTQAGMVSGLGHVLRALGAPRAVWEFSHLEVVMNALIIAPVSFLGSFVWRRSTWRDWTAFGFCFSTGVELVQGLFLSARVAQFSDIVANTAGALLGAAIATWAARRGPRLRRRR